LLVVAVAAEEQHLDDIVVVAVVAVVDVVDVVDGVTNDFQQATKNSFAALSLDDNNNDDE